MRAKPQALRPDCASVAGHTIAGGKMAKPRVSRHYPGWVSCYSKRRLTEVAISQGVGIRRLRMLPMRRFFLGTA